MRGQTVTRVLMAILCAGLLALVSGCGGSSSSSSHLGPGSGGGSGGAGGNTIAGPGPNVQTIVVNTGINGNAVDQPFISLKVCVPNTTSCQTIGNILVDTGSFGLRLLSSASGGALTLSLPQETDPAGDAITECVKFVDNTFLYGPVRMADVTISSELASSIPVNVVGDAAFTATPSSCSTGGISNNNLAALGANGILGVGLFQDDCGPACVSGPAPPPGTYFTCPASGCVAAFVPLAQQTQNPVAHFPTDNNGVIMELPGVGANGAATATGALVFGIGTQSNNGLGSAVVLAADNRGDFTTMFNGQNITPSFIDSGSNGIFFLTTAQTNIASCSSTSSTPGFYCPSTTQNLSATQKAASPGTASSTVSFSIANANTLVNSNPNNTAFNNLGGPSAGIFDWGLAFFLGRNVFVAIAGKPTPGGAGPYWAY
jgi:hypothetical protein